MFDSIQNALLQGADIAFSFAPLWVPFLLLFGAWRMWLTYLQLRTIAKQDWIMLEVRLPKDIYRSPLGMELVLNAIHYKGLVGDFVKRLWKGNLTPWTSLEVASFEGDIHFFIRIEKGQKRLIESQIYAQYPDAEVTEVDTDYTDLITYDEDKYSMWAGEFVLTKKDPYPIKTYVDFGLADNPKEEEKIDPITPMMEWLGSLGKGEQAWIQIVVRYHLDNRRKKGEKWFKFKDGKLKWEGGWFARESSWKEDAKKEIEEIKEKATVEAKDGSGPPRLELTPGQKDTIAALERSVEKPGFDVGIRGIYIAEQDAFVPVNIGGLIGSFKSYGSGGLNGFKPGDHKTGFTYPWQDPFGRREAKQKHRMFDAYKRRSFFHPPYRRKPFVLNSEELATIYHFPGRVATTPTFKRIESRKSEPPTNLPI